MGEVSVEGVSLASIIGNLITANAGLSDCLLSAGTAFICGIIGITMYSVKMLASDEEEVKLKVLIATFVYTAFFGYGISSVINYVFPGLTWTTYFLISGMFGLLNKSIDKVNPLALLKVLINAFVSVTRREKLTTNDLLFNADDNSINKTNNVKTIIANTDDLGIK